MRTSYPARAKPLTGFKPAHRSFAEISLNHLATGAEGGEREKYQQKPLAHHETNTALNEQSILAHRKE